MTAHYCHYYYYYYYHYYYYYYYHYYYHYRDNLLGPQEIHDIFKVIES